jgi:hypothetical protein
MFSDVRQSRTTTGDDEQKGKEKEALARFGDGHLVTPR